MYRRDAAVDSPIGSPSVYRRSRESTTDDDADNARLDSPASDLGFSGVAKSRWVLKNIHLTYI